MGKSLSMGLEVCDGVKRRESSFISYVGQYWNKRLFLTGERFQKRVEGTAKKRTKKLPL